MSEPIVIKIDTTSDDRLVCEFQLVLHLINRECDQDSCMDLMHWISKAIESLGLGERFLTCIMHVRELSLGGFRCEADVKAVHPENCQEIAYYFTFEENQRNFHFGLNQFITTIINKIADMERRHREIDDECWDGCLCNNCIRKRSPELMSVYDDGYSDYPEELEDFTGGELKYPLSSSSDDGRIASPPLPLSQADDRGLGEPFKTHHPIEDKQLRKAIDGVLGN